MIDKAKNIFITGIGGIGISALAKVLKSQGKKISGSDLEETQITRDLTALSMEVLIGHKAENLPQDIDLLIYSSAILDSNPERQEAKKRNVSQLSYPQALGELTKSFEKVICVAGTNGKTTTTAMVGRILEEAYEDPTVIVGSKVLAWNSNARIGAHKYLVLEADEYRRAFLNYSPDVIVITNIEADHLDYYKNLQDIISAFREFVDHLKPGGTVVYNAADPNTANLLREINVNKIAFALSGNADISPNTLPGLQLQIPGEYTWSNAMAAAGAVSVFGIPWGKIRMGLENFSGTWRRFEKVGRIGTTDIISDYAHHPTGLRVLLDTAFDVYAGKTILAVFQPHQKNRTKNLFAGFVRSLCDSEVTDFVIAEIFEVPGRESEQDMHISSKDLVEALKKCGKHAEYVGDLAECEKKVREMIGHFEAILIIGAGDIYKVAERVVGKP